MEKQLYNVKDVEMQHCMQVIMMQGEANYTPAYKMNHLLIEFSLF